MPLSNPLDILLEHDKWATRQILLACEKLEPDQFGRKFEMGSGSLQATTTHMIGAMQRWSDVLARRDMRTAIDHSGILNTPAELLAMQAETAVEFEALVRSHPLDEIVSRVRDGKEYRFTRGAIATHVTTHGMHHRAQCLNMLRHLGVSPLPRSSVMEWTLFGEDAQQP
jgi:uncharacterized damage-inducible protein DinB